MIIIFTLIRYTNIRIRYSNLFKGFIFKIFMGIDIYKKGIPEAGIPPLDETYDSQILAVAGRIIDYVRNQASERGLNIGKNYRWGRGYQLRRVLEETSRELHLAYSDIASTDKQVFQQFDDG